MVTESRLLDTSALVAALVTTHPRHTWALPYLTTPGASICAHSLAEVYSVLSASPHIRLTPADTVPVIDRALTRLAVVLLDVELYQRAIRRISALGLGGGAIYDALIAEAALKVKATQLVTLNAKHFVRLGADVAELVVTAEP